MLYSYVRIPLLLIISLLASCASTSENSFESLAGSCKPSDYYSCFAAGDIVWNTRQSELDRCSDAGQRLCVATNETQADAMDRLRAAAADMNKIACLKGENAEACVRVGMALAMKAGDLPLSNYRHVADEAELFFRKGCELGSVQGCVFRGSSYRVGG